MWAVLLTIGSLSREWVKRISQHVLPSSFVRICIPFIFFLTFYGLPLKHRLCNWSNTGGIWTMFSGETASRKAQLNQTVEQPMMEKGLWGIMMSRVSSVGFVFLLGRTEPDLPPSETWNTLVLYFHVIMFNARQFLFKSDASYGVICIACLYGNVRNTARQRTWD